MVGTARRGIGVRLVGRLRVRCQAFRPHALPLAISVLATLAIYGLLLHQAEGSRDLGDVSGTSLAPLADHVILPGQIVGAMPAAR